MGASIACCAGGIRERRGRLTADNRRGLVDELVVLEGRHHEEGKVHATRDVAFKHRVAHVPAPHWQALAIALLEVAPAHNGSPRVACKHPPARLNLSSRSTTRASRAIRPTTFTSTLIFHE